MASDHELTEVAVANRQSKHGTAKGHSEQIVLSLLEAGYKGLSLNTYWVKWIYTERSMCGAHARNVNPYGYDHSCLEVLSLLNVKQLTSKGPPISIYYSVAQGPGSASKLESLYKELTTPVWLAKNAGLDCVYEVGLRRDVKTASELKDSHTTQLPGSMKAPLKDEDYIKPLRERLNVCDLRIEQASTDEERLDYRQQADELDELLSELED